MVQPNPAGHDGARDMCAFARSALPRRPWGQVHVVASPPARPVAERSPGSRCWTDSIRRRVRSSRTRTRQSTGVRRADRAPGRRRRDVRAAGGQRPRGDGHRLSLPFPPSSAGCRSAGTGPPPKSSSPGPRSAVMAGRESRNAASRRLSPARTDGEGNLRRRTGERADRALARRDPLIAVTEVDENSRDPGRRTFGGRAARRRTRDRQRDRHTARQSVSSLEISSMVGRVSGVPQPRGDVLD